MDIVHLFFTHLRSLLLAVAMVLLHNHYQKMHGRRSYSFCTNFFPSPAITSAEQLDFTIFAFRKMDRSNRGKISRIFFFEKSARTANLLCTIVLAAIFSLFCFRMTTQTLSMWNWIYETKEKEKNKLMEEDTFKKKKETKNNCFFFSCASFLSRACFHVPWQFYGLQVFSPDIEINFNKVKCEFALRKKGFRESNERGATVRIARNSEMRFWGKCRFAETRKVAK